MTTVADGLYQFGGSPVVTSLVSTKIFSTSTKGRAWFVDTAYGGNGNGKSPKTAFSTMQNAFNHIASGDIIYFVGKVTEQLVTPVEVFDVSVIGCGNRPRHADSTPVSGNYAAATWAAPASPVAAQALCRVLQQGWRFVNILWAGSAGCASLELVRNAASGDDERDASHTEVLSCRFAGVASTDSGIKFGSTSYTEIVNNVLIKDCEFQGCAHGINEHSASLQFRMRVEDNRFQANTNHIVVGGYNAMIIRNIFGAFTTDSVKLTGGTGANIVTMNYLSGTYSSVGGYTVANANDEWAGNFNSLTGGITAADPA